jgi:hypothetical protein
MAFTVACIFHNMILRYDGLDVLWEKDVNWDRIDPNGNDDDDDVVDWVYLPTFHDPAAFVPTYTADTIAPADVRMFDREGQVFKHFQNMIARHLHFSYRAEALRWPKTQKDILDRDFFNNQPRIGFPGAGDMAD